MAPLRRRRRVATRGWGKFTMIGLAALASVVPFGYLAVISMQAPSGGQPGDLWTTLFREVPVVTYLRNSTIVSLGATITTVVFSTMAGFGFAKLRFRGSHLVFALLVISIGVPGVATILPNYLNIARLGGVGTYWAPILLYAAGSLPFATVLSASFFRALPDELIESGVLDGAGFPRLFAGILVPLAVPVAVTVGVLAFLGAWNDLLIGVLLLPDPEMRTISVGVAALQGVRVSNIELVLTGSLLSAIPPVTAFIIFQRYLVTGITAGITK
ncbi:carbohydrate ABC transporter permease [Occultella kanbiaonis]|uniref:carbohydrate ABC transporter permease n=1 Tax=Occultella kanbiaonis TaxID=2675754 RepID=UPI0013D0FD21|nr:carbohydrate ABC transporter permease [Occultella kanbiaonis]